MLTTTPASGLTSGTGEISRRMPRVISHTPPMAMMVAWMTPESASALPWP